MRCCRLCCWSCCATGGASHAKGLAVPGQDPLQPISTRQLNRACHAAADGRDHQAGVAAHAAAQLCNPPAGAEHRYQSDPGSARTCQARHHGALHPVATNTIRAVMSPLERLSR
jgi:integrase/recombinase XerD